MTSSIKLNDASCFPGGSCSFPRGIKRIPTWPVIVKSNMAVVRPLQKASKLTVQKGELC